jgi:hypothetical protein
MASTLYFLGKNLLTVVGSIVTVHFSFETIARPVDGAGMDAVKQMVFSVHGRCIVHS